MKSQLIRYSPFPPGSYTWNDPVTGKVYSDQHTTFEERVKQIVTDRLANRRLFTNPAYIDPGAVAKELSESICARLNNDARYCAGNGVPGVAAPSYAGSPMDITCICGAKDWEPITCLSCGGKYVGRRCKKCGQEMR